MFRSLAACILVVSLFPLRAQAQTVEPPSPGDLKSLWHQSVERKYLEYVPKDGKTGPRSVLIDLHGLRPANWKNWIAPALQGLADREGLLVLRPEAINFRWNYAAPDAMQSAGQKIGNDVADDVGFITALIDAKVSTGFADPARVYVTGDSRGGIMAFELMCKASQKIAAAGPMIASMMEKQLAACNPERPVPVMAINGTMDDNIFYDGWIREGKRQLSTPEVMDFWRRQHGCSEQRGDPIPKREGVTGDRTSIWKITWMGCRQEGAVLLYRVNGGGHSTPSLRVRSQDEHGRRNQDFEAIEEFWAFASKFRR
ncbi:MAG: hypothetical protein IOC49_06915 [Methylobacterium sp.]|jgi:polyhydroxybutyrate depolymerase|nr:hypothetical protein [Methylobacterium sp.]